jgi:hypothetical protein
MEISNCRTCGAEIVWAEMPSGKMNCFDVKTSPSGMWALDDRSSPPKAAKIVRAEGSSEPGFTSHFAGCPQASAWRRR